MARIAGVDLPPQKRLWVGLTSIYGIGRVRAKTISEKANVDFTKKIRELTESVDNLAKAKEILEAKGMKVNAADVASFRKLAEDKIWPGYKQQYGELWDRVVSAK